MRGGNQALVLERCTGQSCLVAEAHLAANFAVQDNRLCHQQLLCLTRA